MTMQISRMQISRHESAGHQMSCMQRTISTCLLVSELGRLHGVHRHVLHLDGALTSTRSVLRALLAGSVLDEGGSAWLLGHSFWLCCLQLVAHHKVQSSCCVLHGLLNFLLVWLLKVALQPSEQCISMLLEKSSRCTQGLALASSSLLQHVHRDVDHV